MSDAADLAERTLVLTRELAAPRSLVWHTWTDPAHATQWWGPRGFTTTTLEMDVRVGGRWRYVMHGPDGRDWDNRQTYLEVEPERRLHYRHGRDLDDDPDAFLATVEFEDAGEACTRVTMRLVMPSVEACRTARSFGAVELGETSLDCLEEAVAAARPLRPLGSDAPVTSQFTLVREFAFPRQLVWDAYTRMEHLKHWWGPKGFEVLPESTLEFRPGGRFLYGLRGPDGAEMWGRWIFREIRAPEYLSLLSAFSARDGGITRHPMAPEWPAEMLSSLTLEELGPSRTRLTLRVVGTRVGDAERAMFEGAFKSMEGGFGGTYEMLDRYLATLSS